LSADGTVRVWDALVRILHLGFITGVAAAWPVTRRSIADRAAPWDATRQAGAPPSGAAAGVSASTTSAMAMP